MLASGAVKVKYLDANALIKLVIEEGDEQPLRDFFNSNTSFCATSLCLAEALTKLKQKWDRNQINTDNYFTATRSLIIDCWGKRIEWDDLGLVDPSVHVQVEQMAGKYNLDLSDALQLTTIKSGKYSFFARGSASVLITADKKLATAATSEGIRVWNYTAGPAPAWAY
jgi:predicted nucleic acid-binding protein